MFLAEFGDRTQLVVVSLATRHRPPPVLAGVLLAYATTGLAAVLVGSAVGAALPERGLQVASGALFLAFAAWSLRADDGEAGPTDERGHHGVRLAVSLAGALVVAELGDKSMLATATLAADRDAVAVWFGATAGIMTSSVLAVAAGQLLADRVDRRWLRWASAALFAAFGVAQLVRGVR